MTVHPADVTAPIDPAQLTAMVTGILQKLGLPESDAALVADSLVVADLWGHQSHGVLRLPWYAARLRSGAMRTVTQPETLVDTGPLALWDGHDGVGQVLAAAASDDAVRRAHAHGIGAVLVRNSGHFGTAAYFTRRAARQGCVAILTTNASPAMAPWGGREKVVGTNPWSIAAPYDDTEVVTDIANTAVARGKIYLAAQRGEPIPDSWALDANGVATTNAAAAIDGFVQPMGGHKGYAISLLMDVLSGVLTGSAFGRDVRGPYEPTGRSGCGHLVIAISIAAVAEPADFEERLRRLVDEVHEVPAAPGSAGVVVPGELEDCAESRQRRDGLVLPARTVAELRELAQELDVPFSLS
jgi:LDH2 family malate/lactate/ureidoglycolate dehydrogenase